MKIFIRTLLLSLLVLLFAQQVKSQEFLIRDETFTWEEAEHPYFGGNGFHWWNGDDYSSYPANWVSPHNYFEGRFYYRYEVISQPTNKPFDLMFLIWQFKEDGKHRETGDDRVPLSGGAGSVTEYNNAPPPSRWWTYHENADQLVDFTTIKQYNGGDNRMGLALWSDGNCIPSTWGGTNPDFCRDRKADYFPMRIRITIVAVAEGHSFSGWSNYASGGGGGGGGNPDVTFSIDYQNERTSQNVPNYYQYSFNQTDWTTGSNAKVDLTPGQNAYFKKTETGDIQTLTVAGRPSAPSTGIDFTNETTNTNIGSTIEYSENSDLSGATQGNGSKVELTPGNDLYLRKKATSSAFSSEIYHLTVPGRPSAPGPYNIDFENIKTQSIIPSSVEYSEDGNFGSTESGTNAVINLTPGTDLYFRKKATSGAFASESYTLDVPEQSTPDYGVNQNAMTTDKPVSTNDEYSLNADMSDAVSGTGVAIPLTAGVDVYFRTKATSSSFISKIQRLEVQGAPAAPSYQVNFINKRTNKVVPNTEEYSVNSDMSSATTGSGAYVTVTPGTNLYFRVKANNGQPASDIFELVVPDKPAAPAAFSINFQNETTQGNVPNTMEYSTSSNFSNAVTGSNTVVNVQPGTTLYIRYKATSNAFESEVRQLAVPSRPSAPTAAINFIDETTQDVVPATIEYSTSADFNNAVSGNGNKIDVVPGTDLYFRYKATSDQFRSTSYPLDVPSRTIPTYGADFINSLTNKVVPATDEYSVNANMSGATSGNNTKLTLTPGVDLYFRTKATTSAFLSNIQHLDIPAKTTPNYSVDFATKQTNAVVPATDEYSINANMSGASSGNNTKLTLTPGTDLYFRTKASGSGFQSNIQHLVVPTIPAAPNYAVDFVNKTTTANVPATVEYSTNSNMSGATTGTNTKVNLTPGTDLYLRTKSTAIAFASAIQTLDVPAAPAQPSYVADYSTEKTTANVPATVEYSTNANMSSATTATGVKVSITPGTNLYFRVKATNSTFASSAFMLTVPARPAAPVITINYQTGTTTENITSGIEYDETNTFNNANAGSGVKLTLVPGTTLYFRHAATASAFSSQVKTLAVPAKPAAPSFTVDYVNEKTNEIADNTIEYSAQDNFSPKTDGTGTKVTLTPGTSLYFRKKSTSGSFASDIQLLDVKSRPTITFDGGDTIKSKTFDLTVTFPAGVTGFAASDAEVTNGTVKSVSGTYKLSMEATAPGDVTVKIPANVVTENNFASATFKVHYKNTTGVAKLNGETEILIYPNPASHYLYVDIKGNVNAPVKVTVYSASGKAVKTEVIEKLQDKIDIQSLPVGLYILEIVKGNDKTSLKFMKE